MQNELNWRAQSDTSSCAEHLGWKYEIEEIGNGDIGLYIIYPNDGGTSAPMARGIYEGCKAEALYHANAVSAAIDAAVSEERKLSDQLAKALEEASFLVEMSLGMNLPFMPVPKAHEGSPKQMIDDALEAYTEARK